MSDKLLVLKDRLQIERQQLAEKLNEIDNNLTSIDTVLGLLKEQHPQISTAKTNAQNITQESDRFKDLPFKKAVILLVKNNPLKSWTPKDIFEGLLKGGFKSNSKNFKNTARTMLMHMRKGNEIESTKTDRGFLYMYKEKGSVPHMAGTEPNSDNGGLGERSKPTDL